jgi:Putative peptidoglycan binding domain
MKTFTSLLIGCSLALAGAAMAQQPDQQQTPRKKQAAEKTHAAQAQPGANAAKPQERPAKQTGAVKEHGATNQPGATNELGAGKGRKARANQESATAPETNVSGQPTGAATPGAKQQAEQQRKGMKGRAAKTSATPATTPAAATGAVSANPAAASASAAPSVSATGQQRGQANVAGGKKAKPEPQQVQQIKAQHANFRAQPKPQQVPAVTFNQNRRIEGSDRWQGPQYEVFRSYHPERHDQGWYRSHYSRVELIGGGYYYWNSGYWYPAWGYNPSSEYYAYDGPIYVGQRGEPPDQVIADVQAELQQMGYYQGEVDGLLGPMTQQALTAYQADQGLATTAAIDEPTLDSLGMS